MRARRGTIALSHQVIDLVIRRRPSPEATFALTADFFDAGEATPSHCPMGTNHGATRISASDLDAVAGAGLTLTLG
ncbi:hypothetical protein AB0D71_46925 [Streptomyces avermitilis]|uniref:hypothetical protein n=1 Tax=Streptomyces avermitilis TaxID=33903 RepID=UPI00340762C3